jgi:MFS family permease
VGKRFRLLADVAPLRESPAFRRLWTGTTLSTIGGGLTRYAIPLQIFQLTRSSFAVGLAGLFMMVPTLAVGLLGGTLIDSADRRRVVLVTSTSLAVVSAAMAALALAKGPAAGVGLAGGWQVDLLYALAALEAGLAAVDQPARSTFIAGILPAAMVPSAVNLSRISFLIALTASPAVAGVIASAPHLGLPGCYAIDAVSFGAAIYSVTRLPPMAPEGDGGRDLRAVLDGVRLIRRSQPLSGAFLADLAFSVLAMPLALFPAINAERFGGDPRTLGLMLTAIGAGGLVGAVMSGPLGHVSRPGLAMLACVFGSGLAFAAFAVVAGLWPTLVTLAVVGAVDGFTVALRGTIVQMVAPGDFRGRVLAADWVVAAGGTQLGSLESGALAALTTPVTSAFIGGVACSAAVVAIGVALPGLARYRLPQGLTAQLRNGLRACESDTSVDRCLAVQIAAAFSMQPQVVQPDREWPGWRGATPDERDGGDPSGRTAPVPRAAGGGSDRAAHGARPRPGGHRRLGRPG